MSFERLNASALQGRISATARSLRFRLMLWNIAAGVLTGLGGVLNIPALPAALGAFSCPPA